MNPRLKRIKQVIIATFSLNKSTKTFFSLFFFFPFPSFLKHLVSKTLDFLSMDPLFFSEDYFGSSFNNNSSSSGSNQLMLSDSDSNLNADQLYLVHHRWWNEVRESLFAGYSEVRGVLYRVASLNDEELESEIVLEMRREDDTSAEEAGTSDCEYTLISEWMFLRALKWHNDVKDVGSFSAAGENMQDLFSLDIKLSFSQKTNSLLVKISQKDNAVGAFKRACAIFCIESGLLHIWDFSGQTSQFFLNDRKITNDLGQSDEILLELQVYGFSYLMKGRNGLKDEMTIQQFKAENSFPSSSHKMNGTTDNMNSYFKINGSTDNINSFPNCPPFGSRYNKVCVLGLAGLYNLGNTCFMNSAIQCLAHTPKLVDYFLGDFRKDLNFDNPLGMNGKLALAFGDLLRKLWALGATAVAPTAFKSTLPGFAPQFGGYNQHDSQEFLAFLLDGLHEDLNRVKDKPYIEAKDADGHSDEEVATEHWRNHLARNNSIIVDMCQGQYRSTLFCPVCKKLSVTFDPFMYLSLPLLSRTMRTMTLTVLSTNGTSLPFPVTVTVPSDTTCEDLVQALSTSCSLGENETLLIAEIYNNCIIQFFDNLAETIELIRDGDRLVAYRVPKDSDTSPLVVFMHQKVDEKVDKYFAYSSSMKKFGIPLIARMSDFSKGSKIREKFLNLLHPFLMPVEDDYDGDAQNIGDEDIEMGDVISTTSLLDGDEDADADLEEDDFQFHLSEGELLSRSPKIRMNEPVTNKNETPKMVNVLVSWPDKMIEKYDTSLLSVLPEICKPFFFSKKPQETVSLYKCIELFLKEEPLGPNDMWYCPNCKEHQQARKKLDIWRLPEILIVHLKRFTYKRYTKDKLETFVDFPIEDLNLSTYIIHNDGEVSHKYMLYAVSNHYGSMGGGHYTAFVQDGRRRWYEFDDSHVSPISQEDQIKTSAAYVLFYRRI